MTEYTLFGTESSFYTAKVRAYLDWKRIHYQEVSSTLNVIKSVLLPNVNRAIVPVLQMPDGTFVQDSSDIIAALETRHPESTAWPAGPLQNFVSHLMELFADEWLIIPALHYRWNHNEEWTYREFGRSSIPDASEQQQFDFGQKQAQFFKDWLPEVGVDDVTIPGVEKSYEEFLGMLSVHLDQENYMFGGRPSYADFALYGPLYAHMYRDPESGKLMNRIAPLVSDWVERCRRGGNRSGAFLSKDIVPQTLLPIFAYQMTEQLPVLLSTDEMLDEWALNAAPGQPLPRGFGTTAVTIGGCSGSCLGRSFPLYRLQQALDFYHAMQPTDQERADAYLDSVGGGALIGFSLSRRLKRSNSQLVLER